jgi:hypothetical protein
MYKLTTEVNEEIPMTHPDYEELGIESELRHLAVGDTVTGKRSYRVVSKGVVIISSAFSGLKPQWHVVLRRK